jgi:hypothetical protein
MGTLALDPLKSWGRENGLGSQATEGRPFGNWASFFARRRMNISCPVIPAHASTGSYLQPGRKRPGWLRVDRLLGEHGIPRDSEEGRQEFARRMEVRRMAIDGPKQLKMMRRGWCLGTEAFRKELLAQMHERIGEHHFGEERSESGLEKAQRVVQEGLKRLGWNEADLDARGKGDPEKVKMAIRLRAETTTTIKWIAQRLKMETPSHVNHLPY